jgi:hypothetical protein
MAIYKYRHTHIYKFCGIETYLRILTNQLSCLCGVLNQNMKQIGDDKL